MIKKRRLKVELFAKFLSRETGDGDLECTYEALSANYDGTKLQEGRVLKSHRVLSDYFNVW